MIIISTPDINKKVDLAVKVVKAEVVVDVAEEAIVVEEAEVVNMEAELGPMLQRPVTPITVKVISTTSPTTTTTKMLMRFFNTDRVRFYSGD